MDIWVFFCHHTYKFLWRISHLIKQSPLLTIETDKARQSFSILSCTQGTDNMTHPRCWMNLVTWRRQDQADCILVRVGGVAAFRAQLGEVGSVSCRFWPTVYGSRVFILLVQWYEFCFQPLWRFYEQSKIFQWIHFLLKLTKFNFYSLHL